MIPAIPNTGQNHVYSSMMADANAEASQLTSNMTTLETKVTNYTSWSTIIIGIGFVSYGMLGKSSHKTKTNNSEALDILKKRLANGEITKNQFDQLKNDVV